MPISVLFKQGLQRFWSNVPPNRRTAMAGMLLFTVAATAGLLAWAFKPHYRLLYTDLSLEDSGQIVQELQKANIPYRLEGDGSSILVPAQQLYDVRLKLAAAELPRDHNAGWELFDQTNLGVTDFVQKLNFRRGLEGELARTILELEPVEAVRVHLVIPQESLFRENQQQSMASVTIKLKRGQKLSESQVEGITYLVSSAVEGLSPENVTVVDSRGYILTERVETNEVLRLSSSQLELQRQVETDLMRKGQTLLDKRFGPGRSSIQVTVELDYDQLERTRELYDGDNPAVRSEEVTVTSSTGSDTSSSQNENTITNYELNLTREHSVKQIGALKRLSAAVMMDGKWTPAETGGKGEGQLEFTPLEPSEIAAVETAIKSAIGYDESRGDRFSIVCVPFGDAELINQGDFTTKDRMTTMLEYGQKVLTFIAIVLMLLMVRNFLRRAQESVQRPAQSLRPQISGAKRAEDVLAALPDIEDEMTPEARSAERLKEQVSAFVAEKPDVSARLVRSWLVDN